MSYKQLVAAALVALMAGRAGAQTIPLDPALRTGRLANGFTYYIRHNEEPAKRVQLYLINKVGSILEEEDQRGLAHFMEHMNFNGTKHFPKNDLVDYLQKAGVRFGADLNAYTSFDETVYQLPLPTQDPSLVANGLQIMRDWAQEATLDSVELEKERGIVLEEERLGKGAKDRMSRQYYPVLLNHARYADRIPIGLDSVLLNFRPATIRRFHHDWYRPDLQAIIIVGDVDAAAMEKMVKEKFSDLKNPSPERPRTAYTVPLTGKEQFLTVTDKENSSTSLEILWKHKAATSMTTEADYLAAMKRSLFNSLVNARRFAELSQDPNPSYVGVSAGIQGLMGGVDMFAFDVTAKDGQLERAFQQTWEVIEKIRRYGFTQTELDRAKENYLRGMDASLKEKDKVASSELVGEYQRLFLHSEASPGIEWENKFVKNHIAAITLADIKTVADAYMTGPDRDILVTAADKEKANLPDQVTVSSWIQKISSKELMAYKDDTSSKTLLTSLPKAGKVVKKEEIAEIKVTKLTLSNGIQVFLKPTDFKNDEISFRSFAPGGTSLYSDADYDAAASASQMIGSFGLGTLNPVQLTKLLNGKLVQVGPFIGARSEGLSGSTSKADLETALQLVYGYFTEPRKDSVLYNNIINSSKSILPNRYADPGNIFNDTMAYVMGGYSYRASPPTLDKLSKISLQKAYDIYKERFADASGFTFVFVGHFNTDSITPLLEKYLGGLPALHKNEQARDLGVHIPEGQLVKNVYAGKEDKALVRLVFSGDYHYAPETNQNLHALGQILQIKLLQHLRENESEVYSPSVQTIYNKLPKNRYAVVVAFGCAPKNVDHLTAMVKREFDTLRLNGADPEDIEKYKAAYVKNIELALKDNGFWLGYLLAQQENGDNILQVQDMTKILDKVTPASLKEAAGQFLKGDNCIRFALLPENAASGASGSAPASGGSGSLTPATTGNGSTTTGNTNATASAPQTAAAPERAWEDIDTTGFYKKQVTSKDGYRLTFINRDPLFDTTLGQKMVEAFFRIYPKEVKRFNPHSARQVTFVIEPAYHGVAATSGAIIKFDPSYFRNFPNDVDVVTHEAMHVVQSYKNAEQPGWITEGLADYARYVYGVDNAAANWRLPVFTTSQKYTDAYRVTARWFVWLEKKFGPGSVDKLDALMRSGNYSATGWKKLFGGKTPDQLWGEYADNLGV